MERYNQPRRERVYVKVTSDFDTTGFVQPKAIIWADGRVFTIDQIQDFCPASKLEAERNGDCYTVIIKGKQKHLFFERTDPRHASRLGRWFVERNAC